MTKLRCPICGGSLHYADNECITKQCVRFKVPHVKCGLCGELTTSTGTKRCDSCYELESRVRANPKLALGIVIEYRANDLIEAVAKALAEDKRRVAAAQHKVYGAWNELDDVVRAGWVDQAAVLVRSLRGAFK